MPEMCESEYIPEVPTADENQADGEEQNAEENDGEKEKAQDVEAGEAPNASPEAE